MQTDSLEIFEAERPKLIGLAYRITGSASEAEDIAQQAYLKWSSTEQESIRQPAPWLAKITTHLSLDYLKSAKIQRESYIGPWLPEPFITDDNTPEKQQELDESITMALLLLLEQLSPAERAAFILHDVFHYGFDEIGKILNKTGSACRKLASRARSNIDPNYSAVNTSKEEHMEIVSAFLQRVKQGDMADIILLLKEDVVLHADGGGKVAASSRILSGDHVVGKFAVKVLSRALSEYDWTCTDISYVWFNGSPGIVVWVDQQAETAFNFEIEGKQIKKIHILRNPDKLRFFRNQET